MDLDTFFVSCERLLDSRLMGKPILIGSKSDRGVVASCSYEARTYGIHSAMSMKLARTLCQHAVVLEGSSDTYSHFSNVVTDIIKEVSPVYEKSSIDEFYVDLTGMDKFFGSWKWSKELRQKIMRETGLPISLGLSTSKTVSKVGTGEAKPNNQMEISKGNEIPFLAPLLIKKIPMVGDKTNLMLRNMGVKYIKTLQEMPVELMERVMGKSGVVLWKKAQGIDNSPVIQYQERKSISLERTFERDTTDVTKLRNILSAMAENLSYQLRKGDKLTSCVTVKVRYSDFQTKSKQTKIPYSSSDYTLIQKVLEIFNQLYDRRVLIRLIGVRFSHLVDGGYQINLFEDSEEMVRLYHAMDHVRNKFGQDAIKRGVTLASKGIGTQMNPFNGEPPVIPAHRRS